MVCRAREEWRDPSTKAAARLASEVGSLLINLQADPLGSLAYLEQQLPNFPRASSDWYRLAGLLETVRMYNGLRPDLELIVSAAEHGLRSGEVDAPGRIINVYKAILVERGARAGLEYAMGQVETIERLGFVTQAFDLRAEAAQSAIYAGEFPTAVAMADLVLEQPSSFRARHQATIRRADALAYLGEFDLARASVAEAAPASHGDRIDRAEALISSLEIAYWGGSPGQAIELADSLGALTADIEANLALPLLTGAWADLDLGRPVRKVPIVEFPALAGLPLEVEGIHLIATGAFQDASARFDAAASGWSGFIEPRALICRWAAGDALRRAGSISAGVDRLRDAEALAMTMRFRPLLARIHRSLRLAGIHVSSAERGQAAVGLELTPRESELVRLVEQGLNNIEIARRLGLGRPTVARMLASAMGKVGVERRAQLAARQLV
jgi:DNA-binding CsgD family transcriptional regulator